MNTITIKRAIRRELDSLNAKIDQKIVRGRSYAREARRHKMLISQLYNLNKKPQESWWGRSFGFMSTFLF